VPGAENRRLILPVDCAPDGACLLALRAILGAFAPKPPEYFEKEETQKREPWSVPGLGGGFFGFCGLEAVGTSIRPSLN